MQNLDFILSKPKHGNNAIDQNAQCRCIVDSNGVQYQFNFERINKSVKEIVHCASPSLV